MMSEYTVVMVGKTGHGKSGLGNSILGQYDENGPAFEESPLGSSMTTECKRESGEVSDGVSLHVIDTPGVLDTDEDTKPKETLTEIRKCREMCPNGVNALLLVIPFATKFTKEEKTAIEHLESLFGEELFEYGIIAFTHGDRYKAAIKKKQISTFKEYLDSQPAYFKTVLDKVMTRYVIFDNTLRGKEAIRQRRQLVNHIQGIMENMRKPYMIPEVTNTFGVCFPATSTVLIDTTSLGKMASIQVGTKVISIAEGFARSKLDTVYFFSHAAEDVLAPFVRITTAGGKTLHLSEGHYIYAGKDALKTGALVTAREVKAGDVVHVVDGLDQAPRAEDVIEVKTEIKRGLYCPHTLGGSLVVDGVCVSTYTEVFPPSVAHGLLWPIRALYRMAPNVAAKIALPQGDQGMPKWLGWLYDRYVA